MELTNDTPSVNPRENAKSLKHKLKKNIKAGLCDDLLLLLETAEKVDGPYLYTPSVSLPPSMDPYMYKPAIRSKEYFSGRLRIPIQGEIELITILSQANVKELKEQYLHEGHSFMADSITVVIESRVRPKSIRLSIQSENETEFGTKSERLADLANYVYNKLESSGNIKDYNLEKLK